MIESELELRYSYETLTKIITYKLSPFIQTKVCISRAISGEIERFHKYSPRSVGELQPHGRIDLVDKERVLTNPEKP